MTRSYFIEEVTTWYEFMDACYDEDYDLEDVYNDESYDEAVEDDINDRDVGWYRLKDYLDDLPTGYDYYRRNGWMDYEGLDDNDLESYKADFISWMDDGEYWESEDGEDEEEAEEEPEEDKEEPVAPEDLWTMDFGEVEECIRESSVAYVAACAAEKEKITAFGAVVLDL